MRTWHKCRARDARRAGLDNNGGDVFGLVYDSGPLNGSALSSGARGAPAAQALKEVRHVR